jgi:hypothetical protein
VYYREHARQLKAATKQYYLEHRKEILAKRKQYYEENRDRILARQKLSTQSSWLPNRLIRVNLLAFLSDNVRQSGQSQGFVSASAAASS